MKKKHSIIISIVAVVCVFLVMFQSVSFATVVQQPASAPTLTPKGVSVLYGKPMGESRDEVAPPKPLKFDIDEKYDLKFTDIPKDHQYRKAIVWGIENGLLENKPVKFNPDEVIKMREFILTLYELRWKYHQGSEKRCRKYYEWLVESKLAYIDTITTDLPEARFFISFTGVNPIFCIPDKLNGNGRFEGYRYDPNRIVEKSAIYYMSGVPFYYGLIKNPRTYPVNSNLYRTRLIRKNLFGCYQAICKNPNLVFDENYIKKWENFDSVFFYTKIGVGFMQSIGLLKFDPTFADLELTKPVTRGEFFHYLYLMCDFVRQDSGNDFRVTKDWGEKEE